MPSGRRGAGVRLVLDTNVVVSALIWDGPPERLLDLAVSGEIALFSSAVLLDELAGVLERGKFIEALASRAVTPAFLTRRYGAVTTLVEPHAVDRAVPADADDDHVIGAALGARADAVATGDRHLLELDPYLGIRILAPAAVLELLDATGGAGGRRTSS